MLLLSIFGCQGRGLVGVWSVETPGLRLVEDKTQELELGNGGTDLWELMFRTPKVEELAFTFTFEYSTYLSSLTITFDFDCFLV